MLFTDDAVRLVASPVARPVRFIVRKIDAFTSTWFFPSTQERLGAGGFRRGLRYRPRS